MDSVVTTDPAGGATSRAGGGGRAAEPSERAGAPAQAANELEPNASAEVIENRT